MSDYRNESSRLEKEFFDKGRSGPFDSSIPYKLEEVRLIKSVLLEEGLDFQDAGDRLQMRGWTLARELSMLKDQEVHILPFGPFVVREIVGTDGDAFLVGEAVKPGPASAKRSRALIKISEIVGIIEIDRRDNEKE